MILDTDIPYTLIYSSRRRSIGIRVHRQQVTVRAPAGMNKAHIQRFVAQKETWIRRCLDQQQVRTHQPVYAAGADWQVLGESRKLCFEGLGPVDSVIDTGTIRLRFKNPEQVSPDLVQKKLQQWYVGFGLHYLEARTAHYAQIIAVQPSTIRVRSYKARWGSCSIKGVISYNWKLLQLAPEIVDYVVVHELCHMLEHNHSARFWAHVQRYCPDYRNLRKALKQVMIE